MDADLGEALCERQLAADDANRAHDALDIRWIWLHRLLPGELAVRLADHKKS